MPNIRVKRYNGTAWEEVEVRTDWSQILNKPSTFTPTSHTHSGNDITSGKVAPERLGSGQRTATTFLNGLGNWETVNVGGTVNTTGDQTISGVKTFNDNIFINGSINSDGGTIQVIADSLNVDGAISADGGVDVKGNIRLTGTPTTTNRSRTIEFTGFDKEGIDDFSDNAYIRHTVNSGGLTGSVLEISSQNDAQDGINFITPTVDSFRHNGNIIVTAANIGSQSVNYATSAGSATDSTKLPLVGGSMSGLLIGRANASEGINVSTQGTGSFEALSTNNAAAFMTFHKAGHYAIRFGLDTDNTLKVGGWSMGNVAYTIWHSGNLTNNNQLSNGSGYITSSGTAANATQLPTLYYGGQQLNPQTYFGQGVGVKVAMTGAAGVWGDTLWINGYSGGDVLQMVALHTRRNGEPRVYASAQASNSSSYGTMHEFITSFNRGEYAAAVNSTNTVSGGVKTRLIGSTLYISNNGSNL
jgi:hypothetical protein